MKTKNMRFPERTLNLIGWNHRFSRREFLLISGVMVVAVSALKAWGANETPLIIMDQAKGLVIADPTKCVGCRRCELACTEFNDGKASPTIARIKISRNLNFGPKGSHAGQRGQGTWGNGLVIQDLCKQCPHPVPCANACPNDAIVVKPPTQCPRCGSRQMYWLQNVSEGLSLGNDVLRFGYEQGHQVFPLRWESQMCRGLSRPEP